MTISSNTRKAGPFVGNDTTVAFPFAFKVFKTSDLLVVRLDTATNIETTLTLGTHYSVTLNADQNTNPGGTVTLVAALATGFNLVLTSDIGNLQPTDLTNMGGFYPTVINDALDRAAIQVQQLQEQTDRAIKVPITNPTDVATLTENLVRVAASADNFDIVAGHVANVDTVAAHAANVDTVAANVVSVNAVAGDIANINAVHDDLANINAVQADLANIDVAATHIDDITNYGMGAVAVAAAQAAEADAVAQAATATTQAGLATTAKTAAEAARDAAQLSAGVYADTTAGLAATTSGQYFSVPSATSTESLILYLNSSGSAVEQKRYPSSSAVDACAKLPEGAPAYTNAGGQGDRTASITVSITSGLMVAGTTSNLVDGAFANNATDSIAFGAVSVTDKSITFDFGVYAEKIITEATWKQGTTASHGTWKWQVSADNSTWLDANGSSFTLGGATTQVQTVLTTVTKGYRYYRLLGISGTASGSPYIQEVEFKISASVVEGRAKSADLLPFPAGFPLSKLVSAYYFDEANGTTVKDQYTGNYPIDLTLPTSPNVTLTGRSAKTASGLIQTPVLPSVRAQTILYRSGQGGTAGFLISGGSSSGIGTMEEFLTPTETHKMGGFGLDLFTPAIRSDGAAAYATNRGGWAFYHREMATTYSSAFGLGGRHSTTTSRCADFEVNCAFFWNATLTSDELSAVYLYVRQRAMRRAIYLHRSDAPSKADLYMMFGESTCDGRGNISELSASDQALKMRSTLICANDGSAQKWLDDFELGYNQKADNSYSVATLMGAEFGVAYQRRVGFLRTKAGRKALILKNGKGGTRLAPSSTGISQTTTWNVNETKVDGLFWVVLNQQLLASLQEALGKGIGFGDSVRIGLWIGLNDATSTTYAPDAATYQGYLQGFLDTLTASLPGLSITMIVFRAHNHDPASNATALANVRTATSDFDTANANVTMVDTDAYALNADSVHYTAASNKMMGITLHG